MRIWLMINEQSRPRHIQIRLGDIDLPDSNPLVFDGVLMPGEGTEIYCHGKYTFGRECYEDAAGQVKNFSEWSRHESTFEKETTISRKYSKTEIHAFIRHFEDTTLPEAEFTHDAHIIVAIWYLFTTDCKSAFMQATQRILAYKTATAVAEESKAFHYTLTKFWLLVVREYLDIFPPPDIEAAVNTMLATKVSDKSLPFLFYSRELLFSQFAIQNWVEPDLRSLDKLTDFIRSAIVEI